jgi:hypothetical protein
MNKKASPWATPWNGVLLPEAAFWEMQHLMANLDPFSSMTACVCSIRHGTGKERVLHVSYVYNRPYPIIWCLAGFVLPEEALKSCAHCAASYACEYI